MKGSEDNNFVIFVCPYSVEQSYTVQQINTHTYSFAVNQGNHQNFDPSLLLMTLTDFHWNEAFFFSFSIK